MKKLLVAVDFSKTGSAVLEQAAALANALDAKLWVVHVTSDEAQAMAYEISSFSSSGTEFPSMPGDIQLARDLCADEIKREHRQLLGISAHLREKKVNAQAILLKGDAAKLILEKASELKIDLILLGSHGHGRLHKALLGSVSEAIIHRARCNVMIVPAAAE